MLQELTLLSQIYAGNVLGGSWQIFSVACLIAKLFVSVSFEVTITAAQPHYCCCSGKAFKENMSANGCGCFNKTVLDHMIQFANICSNRLTQATTSSQMPYMKELLQSGVGWILLTSHGTSWVSDFTSLSLFLHL